jgi:hypothetical protein
MLVAASMLFPGFSRANEAPQLLKVRVSGGYVAADARYEGYKRTATGDANERRFLQLWPNVGLNLDGSIYHPNLFDYNLSLQLGLNSEYERFIQSASAEPAQSRTDASPLQFYRGQASILKEKKLSGSIFGNYSLIRRDNDFFSRQTFYQEEFGASLNYDGDTIPWSLMATSYEEEETDSPSPRSSQRDELNFTALNERRAKDRTQFDYLYQDFANQEFNANPYTGIRNRMRLRDSTYLIDEALKLNSNLYFNDIESSTVPSSTLSLREVLNAQHTSSLSSRYSYNFSTRDSGATESVTHDAEASVRHQLYRSLTSSLSVDGLNTSQDAQEVTRYGIAINENYSKQIGDHSRLELGATFQRYEEEREASGSDTVQIINEPHVLTTGIPTFLNQPNVILSSVQVTDITGTTPYFEGSDYLLFQQGSLTEIERVIGGNIPNGSTVLVTYSITNPGSGTFKNRQSVYRFRYELLGQLFAAYGRIRKVENYGGEQFTLGDVDEYVIGVESSWRAFNVGAEYQDYDSSLVSSETIRLFENATFPLTWRSSLNLSASQSWIYYPDTNEDFRRYFHNIVYRSQLTRRLSFKIGGSLYIQRSESDSLLDRDLLASNNSLNYNIGKTTFSAVYEYRYEETRQEEINRHTAYLRVRRNF